MSTRIIGRGREGRRIASIATGIGNVKPFEIKASIGDGSTAQSAVPFLKLTGTSSANENADANITTADVTNNTKSGGVLVNVNGTLYWLPLYAIVP